MSRLYSLLLLLITSASIAFAQENPSMAGDPGGSWFPVGSGIDGSVVAATDWNGKLTVLVYESRDIAPRTWLYTIRQWDGSAWSVFDTLHVQNTATSIIAYRGELYVSGWIESVNNIPNSWGIVKWSEGKWEAVGDIKGLFAVNAVYVYQDELYCAGSFAAVGKDTLRSIARWDGTQWKDVGAGLTNFYTPNATASMLEVHDGELYVSGDFERAGVERVYGIARWNGARWNAVGSQKSPFVNKITSFRNKLYGWVYNAAHRDFDLDAQHVVAWDGAVWDTISPCPLDHIDDLVAVDDFLYVCGADRDDTASPKRFGTTRWDGRRWSDVAWFDSIVYLLTGVDDQLYAMGTFTRAGTTSAKHIARFCDAEGCGKIAGTIYYDSDGDCTFDSSSHGLRGHAIEIAPGPYYTISDSNGRYVHYLPPGTYTARLIPTSYWRTICPENNLHVVTLEQSGDRSSGNDFAQRSTNPIEAVRVSVVAGRARARRPLQYNIIYENIGTVPTSGTIRFFHDPQLTFKTSAPLPTRTSSGLLEWDFTGLGIQEIRRIQLEMMVPLVPAGTKLCGAVEGPSAWQDLGIDARDTFCIEVTGSYDPNDITVVPTGIEENGEITRADSILTYTVRFQNTGNDTAFRVVIIDTLSAHLNPASIRLLASSHPYTFNMKGNGILTWTFDDIMLPDSGASEQNSHGFFKYSVQQRPELPNGAQIPNRVSIYFDYNDPVATNTVVSVINQPASVAAPIDLHPIILYPNPTSGAISLRGIIPSERSITLRDLFGRTIDVPTTWSGREASLDLSLLPAGRYFLTIPTPAGTELRQVTVAR